MVPPLFAGLLGLPAEEDVDLLLYPVFIVWLVCLSISTVTREGKKKPLVVLICPVVRLPEELHKTIKHPQVYEAESCMYNTSNIRRRWELRLIKQIYPVH